MRNQNLRSILRVLPALALTASLLGCDNAAISSAQAQGQPAVQPQAPAAAAPGSFDTLSGKKPRTYRVQMPTVFPGARVDFPPLGEFVQGTKRASYPQGKVLVFEFFSTTCGHCAEASAVIEALVDEYTPKGFEFISVTSEDAPKVREWLAKPENAEVVKQAVALDPGSLCQKALQDRTFQVQTPRFFAIRDGLVLWYGHPDYAEEPFAKIAAGSWEPSSVKQEFIDNALVARAKNQTNTVQKQCEEDGKWYNLIELLESMAVGIPNRASTFELQKFGTMIGPANMTDAGYAYGRRLAQKYATDIGSLRTLARTTLNSPWVQTRDFGFALEMAKAADELGKLSDPRAAEIMGLYYFSTGDRAKAIENQERAVRLQDNAKLKKVYETALEKYKKDEPKPVPYTPRVAPGARAPGAPAPGAPTAAPAAGSPADGDAEGGAHAAP